MGTPREDGFRAEADAFVEMIRGGGGEALKARRAASIDNAWTLAAILDAARASR